MKRPISDTRKRLKAHWALEGELWAAVRKALPLKNFPVGVVLWLPSPYDRRIVNLEAPK